MTRREQQIVTLLKKNPLISQEALAYKLGITRSSAAVHISNLKKKGIIKGKGYILTESPYLCVLGGANVDMTGFARGNLRMREANVGTLHTSLGGVGRNIAENLARMGLRTRLLTAVGSDANGTLIIKQSEAAGIEMSDVYISARHSSSVHLAIMDKTHDLALGLSAMDIVEEMNTQYIQSKEAIIKNAQAVVLDANLPEHTLAFVHDRFPDQTLCLDTVSVEKAGKAKSILSNLHILKSNKSEAEKISGIKIKNKNDLRKTTKWFHERGVQYAFITLGKKGVFYSDGEKQGLLSPGKQTVVNTNGAGDAFTAGVILADQKGLPIDTCAAWGMAAAVHTIGQKNTVSDQMGKHILTKGRKQRFSK